MADLYVTKSDGSTEAFREEKLTESLKRAGARSDVAEKIVKDVLQNARDGVSTQDIYQQAFRDLKHEHRPTAARYSLRRALFDLGPTGFPFEDFIEALFKVEGYTTKVRQHVEGACVSHELDVVATNDEECVAVEVKFHNKIGTRTDTKVTLYMHARMHDIFEKRNEDPSSCPVNRALLVTNTKFTRTAITYSECVGLELMGWDYPKNNGLADRIEAHGLYPITALTRISNAQKEALLREGIVLCRDLKEKQEALIHLGLSKDKAHQVIAEINELQSK